MELETRAMSLVRECAQRWSPGGRGTFPGADHTLFLDEVAHMCSFVKMHKAFLYFT